MTHKTQNLCLSETKYSQVYLKYKVQKLAIPKLPGGLRGPLREGLGLAKDCPSP